MKNSKQVTDYWMERHPSGIYHLLFNTVDRWIPFHRYTNTSFVFRNPGDDLGEMADEEYLQEIPEGLIPDDIRFITTTMQEKDQISFYFIPINMIAFDGKMIYQSGPLKVTNNDQAHT